MLHIIFMTIIHAKANLYNEGPLCRQNSFIDGFVRLSVCREKLKLRYSFDNRSIMAICISMF